MLRRRSAIEEVKRLLVQSIRALAGNRRVTIAFCQPGHDADDGALPLPQPAQPLDRAELTRLRGHADRLALRLAHHDAGVHEMFRPAEAHARELYDAIEEVRCQALGARVLPGVARNLTAALADDLARTEASLDRDDQAAAQIGALLLLIRERLTEAAPPAAAAHLVERWRDDLLRRAGMTLGRMVPVIADQAEFARVCRDLLRDLGFACDAASPTDTPGRPERPRGAAPRTVAAGDCSEQIAVVAGEPPRLLAGRAGEATDAVPVTVPAAPDHGTASASDRKGRPPAAVVFPAERGSPDFDYRIYSRAHDETVIPERAYRPAELERLAKLLRRQAEPIEGGLARLTNRLERLLRAQQRRHWRFDREEGELDAARLTRVFVDPSMPLAYKDEDELEFMDTIVTLLLDNSGSMRGRPMLMTALCADLIARTLERCGIKVEILGYTTREWNGGRSREDWLRAGCPQRPGRLSDLRHVIYKSADAAWRGARKNFGLMLCEALLKENVDGEALLWAHERLLMRRERRKILLVISDGVPLDESTLSENSHDFLERHLRRVIAWIECESPVELIAIGVGHDVTHFYTRATAIRTVEELGSVLIERLTDLFTVRSARGRATLRSRATRRPGDAVCRPARSGHRQ